MLPNGMEHICTSICVGSSKDHRVFTAIRIARPHILHQGLGQILSLAAQPGNLIIISVGPLCLSFVNLVLSCIFLQTSASRASCLAQQQVVFFLSSECITPKPPTGSQYLGLG
jgi:hypothetical protein